MYVCMYVCMYVYIYIYLKNKTLIAQRVIFRLYLRRFGRNRNKTR